MGVSIDRKVGQELHSARIIFVIGWDHDYGHYVTDGTGLDWMETGGAGLAAEVAAVAGSNVTAVAGVIERKPRRGDPLQCRARYLHAAAAYFAVFAV